MDRLAAVCEQVASHNSRLKKVAILASYFRELSDDDLVRAVRFLCCDPVAGLPGRVNLFGQEETRTLSVGYAALRDAALAVTGIPRDLFRICHQEVGDTGETISLLVPGKTEGRPLPLAEAERRYAELAAARGPAEKVAVLRYCFAAYRPQAIKYFVKVITGNLRIGLMAKQVEEAAADAAGIPLDKVRAANNRLGDLPAVALAARRGELHTIEAKLFHPMEFMLAKPLESIADLPEPAGYLVEDKYDGIRSQAHLSNGRAVLYTRGMEESTHAFPELEGALQELPGSAVLDGEILGWRAGRALAFSALQQRIARKRPDSRLLAQVPAVFVAYDLLYRDGEDLTALPIEHRRATLEEMLADRPLPLMISPQWTVSSSGEIELLFDDSRLRGNEGLLLKRRGSIYESGKRSGLWYKLKRPFASLDVVITAAEQGHGRRATMLSDYTFAVRSGDGFANVGKAYSGLTDEEVRQLTRLLRSISTDRFGRVVLVRPEVVLEVAFDGVQKSPRHKGGFALRFPRIIRWRRDKEAADVDHIDRVRELYESSMNLTPHRG